MNADSAHPRHHGYITLKLVITQCSTFPCLPLNFLFHSLWYLHRVSLFLFTPNSSLVFFIPLCHMLCSPLIFRYPPPLPPSNASMYLLAHCRRLGRRFEPKDERADPVMRILMQRNCLAPTHTHTHAQTLAGFEKVNFTLLLRSQLHGMSNANYFEILLLHESWVKVVMQFQSIPLNCCRWIACMQ